MKLNRIKDCYFKYKQLIHIFLFAVVYVSILTFVISVNHIPTASMEPSVMAGDMCVSNRLAYILDEPKRGDIIIFKATEGQLEEGTENIAKDILYCKRIIAIGGDKVCIEGGKVYVNDVLLDESAYLPEWMLTISEKKEFSIPEEHMFVMGDARWGSYDSRYWKEPFVKTKNIVGEVFWVCSISKITDFVVELMNI